MDAVEFVPSPGELFIIVSTVRRTVNTYTMDGNFLCNVPRGTPCLVIGPWNEPGYADKTSSRFFSIVLCMGSLVVVQNSFLVPCWWGASRQTAGVHQRRQP